MAMLLINGLSEVNRFGDPEVNLTVTTLYKEIFLILHLLLIFLIIRMKFSNFPQINRELMII